MTNFHCGPYWVSIFKAPDGIGPYELYVGEGPEDAGIDIGRFASVKEAHIAAFEYILEEAEDLLHHARCCLDTLQRSE
jgi:hypothetical protein